MTGFGIVTRQYEVAEKVGDKYACKLIYDNTVMSINPKYRVHFSEEQINAILEKCIQLLII